MRQESIIRPSAGEFAPAPSKKSRREFFGSEGRRHQPSNASWWLFSMWDRRRSYHIRRLRPGGESLVFASIPFMSRWNASTEWGRCASTWSTTQRSSRTGVARSTAGSRSCHQGWRYTKSPERCPKNEPRGPWTMPGRSVCSTARLWTRYSVDWDDPAETGLLACGSCEVSGLTAGCRRHRIWNRGSTRSWLLPE